jgi:hypothetical protein
MKNIIYIIILILINTQLFPMQELTTEKNKQTQEQTEKTDEIENNFYFFGLKLGYGSFSTGVELKEKENINITHLGLRYMLLFNAGDSTQVGVMGDLIWVKRDFNVFSSDWNSSAGSINYYGVNIFFTVKHKWFYFGVGYEALFWDKKGVLSFEHKDYEHFVSISFGYISRGKVKFYVGFEIKSALFKLDSFEYEGQTYSPEQLKLQEYLFSIGIGF